MLLITSFSSQPYLLAPVLYPATLLFLWLSVSCNDTGGRLFVGPGRNAGRLRPEIHQLSECSRIEVEPKPAASPLNMGIEVSIDVISASGVQLVFLRFNIHSWPSWSHCQSQIMVMTASSGCQTEASLSTIRVGCYISLHRCLQVEK